MAEPLSLAGVAPSSSPSLAFSPGHSYASGPGISAVGGPDARVVAYAIRCSADMKIADRDFSGEIDLHSLICLRRKYEEMGGGSISLRPEWKPGLTRLMPLTQDQLKQVLKTMQETFAVARSGGGVVDITSIYFGAEPGVQLKRLHEVMRLQLEAWTALTERAIARVPENARPRDQNILLAMAYEMITPKELESIAAIADPSANEEGQTIELPEAMAPRTPKGMPAVAQAGSLEEIQARAVADADAAGAGDGATEQKALADRLMAKASLTEEQALAVVNIVDLLGADASDEDLSEAIGSRAKGKLDAVRRALKQE